MQKRIFSEEEKEYWLKRSSGEFEIGNSARYIDALVVRLYDMKNYGKGREAENRLHIQKAIMAALIS